ncbi:MAG: DUF2238 domain-containing protein [Acidimicrobiales bacterium]
MTAAFSAAYLAGFTAFAAARGDRRVLAYLVVWAVLAAAVAAIHRRWPLPRHVLLALSAAGAVHLAGGLLPSPEADASAPILYEAWIVPGLVKFDQLAHAAISAVVTVAAYHLLGQLLDPRQAGAATRAMLAVVVCWGFGAANELFEFVSALRFDDAFVGDFSNAGWDLVFNTAGSAAAAVWLATPSRA